MIETMAIVDKLNKLRVTKDTAKRPEKYSLFWVEDTIGQDWFVFTPSIGDREVERSLVEELHGYYENIDFVMRKSAIYHDCNATFICEIPKEVVEKTDIISINNEGNQNNLGKTYYENLVDAHNELLDRILISQSITECVLRDNLSDNILDAIAEIQTDDMSWFDSAYTYFSDNFSEDSILETFLSATTKDEEGFELTQAVLYFMYYIELYETLKTLNKQGHTLIASLHGQNDILTKIDGMTQLDDGLTSSTRVYIYNGVMYEEQASQREIDDIQDNDDGYDENFRY